MLKFEKAGFSYQSQKPRRGNKAIDSGSVLKDISFEINPGEFIVLLGENGAGKSTLCKLANGLLKPTTGRVLVAGEDTRTIKVSRIARKTGFLFQNPDRQLCRNTVREEILFGLEFALSGITSGAKSKAQASEELEQEKKRRCQEMLDLFRLDGDRDPFGLSRGERQQCALATVLARRPELLILDEPTTGLDYRECVTIMDIIVKLNSSESTTVFMITHDMEVAADFGKRALVLSDGQLIGDGPVREILKNKPLLDRASLLPPQIASLALRMNEKCFDNVFSLDEMSAALEKNVSGKAI
ncbi:MAG: ATP-binding cassette domain-containing protein [Treponema sp.]|nr:ATP-binding cassette domain-containing protein [Treponema sp.]